MSPIIVRYDAATIGPSGVCSGYIGGCWREETTGRQTESRHFAVGPMSRVEIEVVPYLEAKYKPRSRHPSVWAPCLPCDSHLCVADHPRRSGRLIARRRRATARLSMTPLPSCDQPTTLL
jgi:hypothetical protein